MYNCCKLPIKFSFGRKCCADKFENYLRLCTAIWVIRQYCVTELCCQACVVKFVTFLLYHDCIRLVRRTCNRSDNAVKLPLNLLQQIRHKQCKHNLLTTCEQTCYNLCIFMCVLRGCSNKAVTIMIYQYCYNFVLSTLWQSYFIMTVSDLSEQPCNKSDNAI